MIRSVICVIFVFSYFFTSGQQVKKTTYYDAADSLVNEVFTIDVASRKLQGPYTKFHQNGKKAISGFHHNNKPDSNWIFYFESGSIKSQGQYKNGLASGFWKSYYENGNIKNEGKFKQSKQEGEWKYYYENGNPKLEAEYLNGVEFGNWTYFFESGPIKAITRYNELEKGSHTTYFYTGEISAEGQKIKKKSTGTWTTYYKNGSIKSSGRYQDGVKEGEWITYYKNGQIESQGDYQDGRKTGSWIHFHENGVLKSEGELIENQKDGQWTVYSDNGDIQNISDLTIGTGPTTSYHTNGQIASTGFMKDGLMDSSWTYFDPSGIKIGKANYSKNEGEYVGLFPNGSIRIKGPVSGSRKVGEWIIFDSEGNETGTYHPYYNQQQLSSGDALTTVPEDIQQTAFDATKSEYRYQNRINRYFDEVVNEFDAWIISSNPLLFVIDRLPVSVEYYQQERLGYELIYEHLRSPFTFNEDIIGIAELFYRGNSLSFRQKFYSESTRAGMYYFGHQVRGEMKRYSVKTQESSGFRNIITSNAYENTFTYGWMVGWKFMLDAGETGLSIDAYTGINIGLRSWQLKEINDEAALETFSQVNTEPLIIPVSFGLNIGWAFQHNKKKKRKR